MMDYARGISTLSRVITFIFDDYASGKKKKGKKEYEIIGGMQNSGIDVQIKQNIVDSWSNSRDQSAWSCFQSSMSYTVRGNAMSWPTAKPRHAGRVN